jgi:uncharacterized membrane protein YhaH (DUF805 family)
MLEAQGWSVFWDRQILPGQQWSSLIEQKLNAAKAVLVVWSRSSVQSEWVKAEAMAARDRGILVPVRIDATPIPLPFGLIQTADLDPERSGETEETVHLLMTNLSRLVALPLANARPALQFAAAPYAAAPAVPAAGGRPGAIDWKQVLFELDGRINRKFYWIGLIVLACLAFLLEFMAGAVVQLAQPGLPRVEVASQAGTLSFFVTLYPTIVIAVKRFHDFDWSGWWAAPLMVASFIGTSFSPYLQHGMPGEAAAAWFVVVLFGIAPLVALGLIPGKPGPNQYGPQPG